MNITFLLSEERAEYSVHGAGTIGSSDVSSHFWVKRSSDKEHSELRLTSLCPLKH